MTSRNQFFQVFITALLTGIIGGVIGHSIAETADNDFLAQTNPPEIEAPAAPTNPSDITSVISVSSESVVSILVSTDAPTQPTLFANLFPPSGDSSGTGFIVSEDGLVVTNRHVVDIDNPEISVILNNGIEYPAALVSKDPFDDIAFIKITVPETFTPIPLGNSDSIQVGEQVYAIGNALGQYGNSVTSGIISGVGREILAFDGASAGFENISGLIQTDAAINLGNSGGPLINARGEVIGINVAVAEAANGIGFAIPANDLKPILTSVQENGEIIRPVLGVQFLTLNPAQAQEISSSIDHGAILVSGELGEPAIIPGGAGEAAGLQEGDVILQVDQETVNQDRTLNKIIRNRKPGDEITMRIFRDGQELEITAILGSSKDLEI